MDIRSGLLGRKLGHSYSPQIHAMLGSYEYPLYEMEEEKIESFLRSGNWTGINVTIPYKKTVFPYMTEVSEASRRIGSVNTVIRRPDGSLYGDITDVYGFTAMVMHTGIEVKGRKTLVLGNGGAAAAVKAALEDLGARPVIISRRGEDNYTNLDRHVDAGIIVNTTPLGMYPNTGEAAVDLRDFPHLEGVLDIIYNPAKTKLLLQAEEMGIPCGNGLYMLVAQAKRSSELFTGKAIPDSETDRIYRALSASMQNIVLIGMPGCGKSTAAANIARLTGRPSFDSDEITEKRAGLKPSEMIPALGEKAFRDLEHAVLEDLGKLSGAVIATGGGAVVRPENYAPLHQNGVIIWLQRPLAELSYEGRPLSLTVGVEKLYEKREALYASFADAAVKITGTPEDTAKAVIQTAQDLFSEGSI